MDSAQEFFHSVQSLRAPLLPGEITMVFVSRVWDPQLIVGQMVRRQARNVQRVPDVCCRCCCCCWCCCCWLLLVVNTVQICLQCLYYVGLGVLLLVLNWIFGVEHMSLDQVGRGLVWAVGALSANIWSHVFCLDVCTACV